MQRIAIILAVVLTIIVNSATALGYTQHIHYQVYVGTTLATEDDPTTTDFAIPVTASTTRINVYSTGSGDLTSIGAVTFSGTTPTSTVDFVIGTGPLDTDSGDPLSTNWAQNCAGITFTFNARLSGAIAGNLTGAINPTSIVRLQVAGQVSAPISASGTSGTTIGYISVGSTTSAGTIMAGTSSAGGSIGTIIATSSGTAIAGAISALSGSIGDITATGAISISSGGIQARDGITSIVSASIASDVTSNANDGSGDLYHIETTAGNLSGAITVHGLPIFVDTDSRSIKTSGDFNATLDIAGDLVNTIEIGGAMGSGSAIHVGGNMFLGIKAEGNLTSITVDGDIIATFDSYNYPDRPVRIESRTGSIGSLSVGGEIYFNSPNSPYDPVPVLIAAQAIGSFSAHSAYIELRNSDDELLRVPVGTFNIEGDASGALYIDSFDELIVTGSMYATFELGTVAAGQTAYIGHNLYDFTVDVDLAGQILANALNSGGIWPSWECYVKEVRLIPNPYYSPIATALGGGAVGLVPFRLYDSDCNPPHTDDWSDPGTTHILNSQFSHLSGVTAKYVEGTFYGPVATAASDLADAVHVWYFLYREGEYVQWADLTIYCHIEMHQTNSAVNKRSIRVYGDGTHAMPPGLYAITVANSGDNRVYSDGTLASTPPALKPNMHDDINDVDVVQYNFTLFADCDANNAQDDDPPPCQWACIADVDDGSGTGATDNSVDINDLIYYLVLFGNGDIRADIDDGSGTGVPDQSVTIDDLLFYLVHFQAGC